jgi:hypothetical protein
MNKHKYKIRGGHVPKGPLTGWIFSDAVLQIKCPRCKSTEGYCCERPKGRQAWPPHVERIRLFYKLFPSV